MAEIALFLVQKRLFDRFPATVLLVGTLVLCVLRFVMTAAAGQMSSFWATLTLVWRRSCMRRRSPCITAHR